MMVQDTLGNDALAVERLYINKTQRSTVAAAMVRHDERDASQADGACTGVRAEEADGGDEPVRVQDVSERGKGCGGVGGRWRP